MRKYIVLLVAAMFLVACGSEEEEKNTEELKESIKESEEELKETYRSMNDKIDNDDEISETEETEEDLTEEDEEQSDDNTNDIDWDVNNIVDSDLDNTTITDLRINEDASVDEERYIVLVDLEWDVKNKPNTTKDMLDMYSDHLAAKLSDNEMIYELVLFWTVPYHNENESILKRTYENQDEGMYLEDEMKDITVFD